MSFHNFSRIFSLSWFHFTLLAGEFLLCDGCLPGINLNWTQDIKGFPDFGRATNLQQKSVPGDWGPWQSWSVCSSTCGSGQRTRFRSCVTSQTCYGDGTQTRDCDQAPCPTFSDWTTWSSCSKSCGQGVSRRERFCIARPGERCEGNKEELELCNVKDCAAWTDWGAWGSCSATCGSGTMLRQRSCSTGSDCPGSDKEESRCQTPACGAWNPWKPWRKCSASCGEGFRFRTRECSSPGSCQEGKATILEKCMGRECRNDIWSPWSPWGPCEKSCGSTRKRQRFRKCLSIRSGECEDPSEEEGDCPATSCSSDPDSSVSAWLPWQSCSSTCGNGMRIRFCKGDACTGPALELCRLGECPSSDSEWSNWSSWGSCSVTCGSGEITRKRTCPQSGRCLGERHEHKECFSSPCPIFSSWGPWEECRGSSTSGTRARRRSCLGELKNECDGTYVEFSDCTVGPAFPTILNTEPIWTPWLQWTSCSVTCGVGQRVRSRLCIRGTVLADGSCVGVGVDSKLCVISECSDWKKQENTAWETWTSWSSCSQSCGIGTRSRNRKCSPATSLCIGPSYEEETCNTPCLTSWQSWSMWTECSASCGAGLKQRSRLCPGSNCPGTNSDVMICTTGVSCTTTTQIPLLPGPWGSWGACSAICGRGTQARKRVCPDILCESKEERPCVSNDCRQFPAIIALPKTSVNQKTKAPSASEPRWASWGSWSDCSSSCGRGTSERRRFCIPGNCEGSPFEIRACEGTFCESLPFRDWPQKKSNSSLGKPRVFASHAWTSWGDCSVSCGLGFETRIRKCSSDSDCQEPSAEYRVCHKPACHRILKELTKDHEIPKPPTDVLKDSPIAENFKTTSNSSSSSSWMEWMPCSVSCGTGYQTRYKNCQEERCPKTDIRICQTNRPCSESNGSSPWMEWGDCSSSCGLGYKTRYRHCTETSCNGPETDIMECTVKPCATFASLDRPAVRGTSIATTTRALTTRIPRNLWTPWFPWSACSTPCSSGMRSRIRRCRSIGPCVGYHKESQRCRANPDCPSRVVNFIATTEKTTPNAWITSRRLDPRWSSWFPWSVCSPSCGRGNRFRRRKCYGGIGSDCEGDYLEMDACRNSPCSGG